MIGAPTDFRHIEGAKIGASGRMEKVQGKFIFANKPFFMLLLNVIRQIFNCEKFPWAPVTLVLLCIIVVVD